MDSKTITLWVSKPSQCHSLRSLLSKRINALGGAIHPCSKIRNKVLIKYLLNLNIITSKWIINRKICRVLMPLSSMITSIAWKNKQGKTKATLGTVLKRSWEPETSPSLFSNSEMTCIRLKQPRWLLEIIKGKILDKTDGIHL